jgi:hypothetical protein
MPEPPRESRDNRPQGSLDASAEASRQPTVLGGEAVDCVENLEGALINVIAPH